MSYIHTGAKPVVLRQNPIDPDSTDWFLFTYEEWIRPGETITTHSGVVIGGTIVTDSTLFGTVTVDGIQYTNVYGIEAKATAGSAQITLTHRKTTTAASGLNRTSIDHSMIIPVREL